MRSSGNKNIKSDNNEKIVNTENNANNNDNEKYVNIDNSNNNNSNSENMKKSLLEPNQIKRVIFCSGKVRTYVPLY